MYFQTFAITLAAASTVQAVTVPRYTRQSACYHYTIINTRGNGTPQGPSTGFRTINANIVQKAASAPGTDDIVRCIHDTIDDRPAEYYTWKGYSLGVTAATNALPKLTGDPFHAVKGVFLIGNPERRAGLTCSVDSTGGTTTRNSDGISSSQGGIPDNWVSKTMDVCASGDGICNPEHGLGLNVEHLSYPSSSSVQSMGTSFVIKKLRDARSRYRNDREDDNDSREDDSRDDDSRDDDRGANEDRREDDARTEDDDRREDNGSTPPYSSSPQPKARPAMSTMLMVGGSCSSMLEVEI